MRSMTTRPWGQSGPPPFPVRAHTHTEWGGIYEQGKQVGVGDERQDAGSSEQEVWDAFGERIEAGGRKALHCSHCVCHCVRQLSAKDLREPGGVSPRMH